MPESGMTSDQLRMARALLRLSIAALSELADIDKMVLVRYEAGRRAQPASIAKIRAALVEQGVVFVGAIEPLIEATVALRYGTKIQISPGEGRDSDEDGEPETVEEAVKAYWSDPDNKNRLSSGGRKALGCN